MIDWSIAQRVAGLLVGSPPPGRLPDDIVARAQEYQRRVSAYTQLEPAYPLPAPEGVDRNRWVAANHESMRPLLEPLAARMGDGMGPLAGPLRAFSGVIIAAQVGALTGLLAQRVLGQYDLVLLDAAAPTRLLLVTPNLAEAAQRLEVDLDQLTSWVTVHEVTHAVQFTSVPWLREHLAGLVRELLDGLEVRPAPGLLPRLPTAEDLRGLVEAARSGELLRLVLGPERHALIDRIQSAMSLIEGHAEHVMDAVGAELLDSLPQLRAALDKRRRTRSPAWQLLERLLGLELKMRQYEDGRRFCDAVVDQGGIDALNRAWRGPEWLPTTAEVADPAAWLRRTNVPVITSPEA
jgi:coenzyme F420 biosynthesis associated uncharacterized protein